jgi:hypothetical protein
VREDGGFAEPWEVRVTTYGPADPERVLAHMSSMSWIAALTESKRVDVMARMRAIVSSGETPQQFPLHVELGLSWLR